MAGRKHNARFGLRYGDQSRGQICMGGRGQLQRKAQRIYKGREQIQAGNIGDFQKACCQVRQL